MMKSNEKLYAFLNRGRQKEIDVMYADFPQFASLLSHGYANGYVAVPSSHPLYKKSYDEANKTIDIHGGLTFVSPMDKVKEFWPKGDTECIGFDSIDEIPNDYWVFGFDTLHYNDDKHLDKDWCIRETMSLIDQLKIANN